MHFLFGSLASILQTSRLFHDFHTSGYLVALVHVVTTDKNCSFPCGIDVEGSSSMGALWHMLFGVTMKLGASQVNSGELFLLQDL